MTDTLEPRMVTLLAERLMREISERDWAIRCLEEGFDSKHLRMLAAAHPNDWPSVVNDYFRLALVETGLNEVPDYVVLLRYAQGFAKNILTGEMDSIEGSDRMSELVRTRELSDDLSAWYEIEDYVEAHRQFVRTGRKDECFYIDPEKLYALIKDSCSDFLERTKRNFARISETTFDQCEDLFKDFLVDNGHVREVQWVFAEDLIYDNFDPFIRVPLPAGNRASARRLFDKGKVGDFGIRFSALCLLNNVPCAVVVLPDSPNDSQYRSMGSQYIKFVSRYAMTEAKPISSRLRWMFKTLFARERDVNARENSIPSRNG